MPSTKQTGLSVVNRWYDQCRREPYRSVGRNAVGRTRPGAARAKVLEAASTLFYRDGIHAVGVDTVAAEAGVTKAALYGNFGSKSGLVVAYLRERDRRWQEEIDRITAAHTDPRARVLAVFDAYGAWLSRDGYRGCAFLNAT